MDWKRIMNKRLKKKDRAEKQTTYTVDVKDNKTAWEEVQRFLTQLLPEINLRLLLETEPAEEKTLQIEQEKIFLPPARLLWVESVTVTSYQSVPVIESSGKPGFFRKRFRKTIKSKRKPTATGGTGAVEVSSPSERIWNRLMGRWGNPHSLKK